MNWDYTIPQPLAGGLSPAHGQSMDSEQFAEFYNRSARSLWAYLARVSRNPALADDLMQEAYLRFLNAAAPTGTWNAADAGEVGCRRYLFRIATNLLRDHWRRPSTTPLDELPETTFACAGSSAQHEAQQMLDRALIHLRPRDRQLLWLAYAEDYTHDEIAEITGMHSASIRVTLFRARRKMAHLLRQQESITNKQDATAKEPA